MISFDRRKVVTGLLLMTIALLASGCASDGSYSGTASVGVYGEYYGGYYGGYPGYYGGNVVVGAPMPPPGGVRPPGSVPPPNVRPPAPPHVSQMPSRPMPAPAPRPMPAARGGGGRR